MARRTLIGLGIAAGAAAAAALGGQAVGNRRLAGRLDERRAALAGSPGPVDRDELPAPVRRWLDAALVDVPDRPGLVRLEQRFDIAMGDGRWRSGTAVHVAAVDRPGFSWSATVRMGPGLRAHVEDALVDGEGWLVARVLGVVPVVDLAGAPTSRAELLRWLAELPWTPVGALAPGLTWRQLDDHAVQVDASTGTVQGAVRLDFDPATGLPRAASAPDRPRDEGGTTVERPWRGTYAGDVVLGGLRIPPRAEVSWQLDDRWEPYFRGEVTAVAVPPAP